MSTIHSTDIDTEKMEMEQQIRDGMQTQFRITNRRQSLADCKLHQIEISITSIQRRANGFHLARRMDVNQCL